MKIRRMILKGVRNFQNLDLCLEDDWSSAIPDSLLLVGPNGSGKTTLLQTVANLWGFSYLFFMQGERRFSFSATSVFVNCHFAALEISGLDRAPIWFCFGPEDEALKLRADYPKAHIIYSTKINVDEQSFNLSLSSPGEEQVAWVREWEQRFIGNIVGAQRDLPNLVFLESETRILPKLEKEFDIEPEPDEYNHLALYRPVSGRKGSIENYLFTLSAVDRPAFDSIASQINQFWIGKRLAGFDPRTRRLMVEIEATGERHLVEGLSSGEKQVLLMIAFITRWLRPGGIVLIDEPDLHLNVSLTNALVSHLRRLVSERDGQLIIASHVPELWNQFPGPQQIRLSNVSEAQL